MSHRTLMSSRFARLACSLPLALALVACGDDGGEETGGSDTESTPTTGDSAEPSSSSGSSGETADGSSSSGEVELPDGCNYFVPLSDTAQDDLLTAFVDVQPGEVVCVGEGTFMLTRQLTLTADDVTVRGAGQATTVFDFSGQQSGANGILIEGDDNTIEALTVVETPGDGIRANDVDGITFLNVTVGWAAEAEPTNGAYALYPVQSQNVTIDGCIVYGAADAGVYLGQSTNSLIQNSEAYGNVIGIEVENSTDTIVRDNYTHDNSNGILVITLPGLDILDGKRANVYNNRVENNNTPNFGDPGTTVGLIPPGVGILLVATDTNEIWNNDISGNDSVGIAMISFLDSLFGDPNDPEFDVFSEGNYFHDNTLTDNALDPDQLVLVLNGNASPGPEIVIDGCSNADSDPTDPSLANCFSIDGASFYNQDECGQAGGSSEDVTPFACEQPSLPTDSPVDPN